eukprot:m.751519 g.751519  ORF g.751519 m.751519 type:complete len:552 (+) comp23168_c0_seq5:257-1912(+)
MLHEYHPERSSDSSRTLMSPVYAAESDVIDSQPRHQTNEGGSGGANIPSSPSQSSTNQQFRFVEDDGSNVSAATDDRQDEQTVQYHEPRGDVAHYYDDEPPEPPCCSCACVREVCGLFCCPPCPSIIVAKQAFMPPTPPSYSVVAADSSSGNSATATYDMFIAGNKVVVDPNSHIRMTMHVMRTRQGHQICGQYLQVRAPRYTILFSHGNAVDIGEMMPFMAHLCGLLNCSIFSYDYSGYGASTGKPRERAQYYDIAAAWHCLTETLGIPPERIVLYGQSIGSSPSTHFARVLSRQAAKNARRTKKGHVASQALVQPPPMPCAGLILHSPLLSGIRVLIPSCKHTLCCDPFKNLIKIKGVEVPTLVLHGELDNIVTFHHGETLHKLCKNPVEPLFLRHADHNNIEQFTEYFQRLAFFFDELDAIRNSLMPDTDSTSDDVITRDDVTNSDVAMSAHPSASDISACPSTVAAAPDDATPTTPFWSPLATSRGAGNNADTSLARFPDDPAPTESSTMEEKNADTSGSVISESDSASSPLSPELVEVDADTIAFV